MGAKLGSAKKRSCFRLTVRPSFVSRTAPQFVLQYASDYDHLARVFEWSTSGEEGEE